MANTPIFGYRLVSESTSEKAKANAANENALIAEVIDRSTVISRTTTATPVSPTNADVYIVPASGVSGAWVGHEKEIAVYYNGWIYFAPVNGKRWWVEDESVFVRYDTTQSPAIWDTIGSDGNAIHDDVAGEIAAITEKTALHNDDLFLIEDSESSNNKKRVKKSNITTSFSAAKLIRNATLNVVTSTTTAIPFNTTAWDTDTFFSGGNPTRATVPTGGAGVYEIKYRWHAASYSAVHVNQIWIAVNGGAFPGVAHKYLSTITGSSDKGDGISVELNLAAADYVEAYMFHTKGSDLVLSASDRNFLSIRKVGPAQ